MEEVTHERENHWGHGCRHTAGKEQCRQAGTLLRD